MVLHRYKIISITLTIIVIIIYVLFLKSEEEEYLKFVNIQPMRSSGSSNRLFGLDLNYVIDNNCTNETINIIQIVTSFAGNVEARSALRRAYPKSLLKELGVYRVFLLALLKPGASEVTQNALINENERFNDIVQGSFIENYRNLTYKHLMGIKWAIEKCQAPYIVKMDDDIITDMYSLIKTVRAKDNKQFDVLGYILKDLRPIRLKANKWYVTKEEYNSPSYPPFMSGWLYVLRFSAAEKLINAIETEKYFWIDDVFVTGILAKKMNLVLEDMSEYYTLNPEYFECCVRDRVDCGFFVGPSSGDYNLNIDFQKHSEKCHVNNCTKYANGKTFKNSCVVSRKLPSIGIGLANLNVIKL